MGLFEILVLRDVLKIIALAAKNVVGIVNKKTELGRRVIGSSSTSNKSNTNIENILFEYLWFIFLVSSKANIPSMN